MSSGRIAPRPVARGLTLFSTAVLISGLGLGCAPDPGSSPPPAPTETSAGSTPTAPATSPELGSPTPTPSARISLPKPTGNDPVGVTELVLIDPDRKDPWQPPSGNRRVVVSIFYPAAAPSDRPAAYMTAAESEAVIHRQRQLGVTFDDDVQDEILRDVRIHATVDATPATGRHPLVLLSPGFNLSRKTLTGLATELASHGYVVGLLGHNFETAATDFPDGEITSCAACSGDIEDVPGVRAQDATFVLDQLLADEPPWPHASMINSRRIGMAGHSIGGNASLIAMIKDKRIRAGTNLDGTFYANASRPVDRPFLMIGTQALHGSGTGDATWQQTWDQLSGPRTWLTVADTAHLSFTDYPALLHDLNTKIVDAPLGGNRTLKITRTYVTAFFDHHLRDHREPILKRPDDRYPEVAILR